MVDIWVAYAAIVSTLLLLLEFRRWTESRRTKVDVFVGTEDGTLSRDFCFAVVVLNKSAFTVHVVRSGFTWGAADHGLDLVSSDSELIGEVGPLGARRVHYVREATWRRALQGVTSWGRSQEDRVRAWIELTTGEKLFSLPFRCELKSTGPSLLGFLPPSPFWKRVLNKVVPTRLRWWLQDKWGRLRSRE